MRVVVVVASFLCNLLHEQHAHIIFLIALDFTKLRYGIWNLPREKFTVSDRGKLSYIKLDAENGGAVYYY